jgi:hypothetical protein
MADPYGRQILVDNHGVTVVFRYDDGTEAWLLPDPVQASDLGDLATNVVYGRCRTQGALLSTTRRLPEI